MSKEFYAVKTEVENMFFKALAHEDCLRKKGNDPDTCKPFPITHKAQGKTEALQEVLAFLNGMEKGFFEIDAEKNTKGGVFKDIEKGEDNYFKNEIITIGNNILEKLRSLEDTANEIKNNTGHSY